MAIRRPAVLAATTALALIPALTAVTPAQAAPAARVAAAPAAAPTPQELIQLVLTAFPANIQADVQQILAGDFVGGLTLLLTDASKLTATDLQTIAANLQALLGQLPLPQQTQLRTQLKSGLSKQEVVQVLLAPR
ncbi:hypothetical protein ACRYCC_39810 [Actinomadura scrupuli]|uniref:hypothetical protein n=1 Tax=Actinomadura scrupuli TaxID=559629 RepID=UPI003D967B0E